MVPKSMSAEGAFNGGGPVLRIRTTMGQIAFGSPEQGWKPYVQTYYNQLNWAGAG